MGAKVASIVDSNECLVRLECFHVIADHIMSKIILHESR